MIPQDAYDWLRWAIPLRPELRFRGYPEVPLDTSYLKPYEGACYIATEVFCFLVPDSKPYCNPQRTHFWAQVDEEVWDPTFDQFDTPFDYSAGRKTHFKKMCKRGNLLLEEVNRLILTQS